MADITKTVIKSISGSAGSKRAIINPTVKDAPLCELYTQNSGKTYAPAVEEGIEWETERKGSPGKLTFTVLDDGKIKMNYGNPVAFKYGGKKVFYGYIFTMKPTKDGKIEVTAYDQLRYLKNKHTYVYKNKRCDQVIKMIATDFKLNVGTLVNTKKSFSRVEDNATLFDIIGNAMDDTTLVTGKLYVLYDDYGKLTLKAASSMLLDHLIDEETAQDYDYKGSIDDKSYSKVQVYYDNDGKREYYIAQSKSKQNAWGVLQLTEKAASQKDAKLQAKLMLDMYSKPTRTLTISGAFGNVKVRAGTSVPVILDLYDTKANTYMLVEKAKHIFKENEYTMDLTVTSNKFTGE